MLSTQNPAPDFSLPSVDGRQISLSDYRGKRVLVQFHRFAGCPVCNLHVRSFVQRSDELRAAGIEVVALFHTPLEELKRHMDHHQAPFPILADPDKVAFSSFEVESGMSALMSLSFVGSAMRGMAAGYFPTPGPHGGMTGLPAVFLVDENGLISDLHYGSDATDSWSVAEVIERVSRLEVVAQAAK